MAIKTENLAILMTDIVGYTEATVHQSRSDNEELLATHNRILLPIVRRYSGRHIKSIGDALLLVFRSPTDAMLCAMAMQDALYEYNRSAPKEKRIHIRVGASLGEVRVTRSDVFGEPVNLTSRVAGITPADEIYMSEALFMAMNKAEVPSQEVGWKELKGIGQPVRIYNIPRFATPRLVPNTVSAEDLADLVYPYGGAHLGDQDERSNIVTRLKRWRLNVADVLTRKPVRIGFAVLIVAGIALSLIRITGKPSLPTASVAPNAAPTAPAALPPLQEGKVGAQKVAPVPQSVPRVTATATPPATSTPSPVSAPSTPAPELTRLKVEAARAARAEPEYKTISAARRALSEKKITKIEYTRIRTALDAAMDQEIEQAKRDLKAGSITRAEYRTRVQSIKHKYDG